MIKKRPVLLMILDGFGLREKQEGNAVAAAKTPNIDRLFSTFPDSTLEASGMSVGLPEGQMGNSEVGHLNIGAGRSRLSGTDKDYKIDKRWRFFLK